MNPGMSDSLTAETIQITGHGDDDFEAYVSRPTEDGTRGGMVVIHHMPGYDRGSKEIVRRFAELGYDAVIAGLAVSIQYLATFASRASAGRLVDTAGLRRRGGWADTVLPLPGLHWRDVLTGVRHAGLRPPLSELTRRLPVALLIPEEVYLAEQEQLSGDSAR